MKRIPPASKASTVNPKDLFGLQKVSITKIPAVALIHEACAMMDGARKYSPYNWRSKKVVAHIYVDALFRHVMDWFEGQEKAPDSGVHHLGHARACLGILLDAQFTGNLVDDRPYVSEDMRDRLQKLFESLEVKDVQSAKHRRVLPAAGRMVASHIRHRPGARANRSTQAPRKGSKRSTTPTK